MSSDITLRPPFEIPHQFKRALRWAERKVPNDYSDGQQRHWPGTPTYRPSAEEHYRCTLGQKWAEHDGVAQPGRPVIALNAINLTIPQGVRYYLDKLPQGYAMFETDQPGGSQVYRRLFGHPSGRFYDSAATYVPHFLWLMSGMDGACQCKHCSKNEKPVNTIRPTRAPREVIDRPVFELRHHSLDLVDKNENTTSSRTSSTGGGIAASRTQRQVRQAGAPRAVDEEGTEDIYKDCLKKLENAKGGKRGVEIDLTEDDSIDWKADRQSLPHHLNRIEQQHSFIPRIGELVLWCPTFLDDHYLMLDRKRSEYKFYSYDQRCFHGFPAWRGGIVAAAPSASIKNGPIDFTDILDSPTKKTSFNTAGFRVETMPDPNDDMNKAMSKQYKYVPLRAIRPLNHWQILLKGIPRHRLHPSIEYALTCMTSLSLLEKWRFNGDWPNARIFCKGIYLGSELVTVGDTIRLLPSKIKDDLKPDVLVVESIRYNLLKIQPEHTRPDPSYLCGNSYIAFVGSAYTTNQDKLMRYRESIDNKHDRPVPLSAFQVKTLFRCVGSEEYGQWYAWHMPRQRYEVSHEQVLGRLYEADAVRLWTCQNQIRTQHGVKSPVSLDFDCQSVLAGRQYATETDTRLPEPESKISTNWFLADTRAEALAISTLNGIDVGKFHEVRTPPTVKQWRMQVKIADGQQLAPELSDEYITDLTQLQLYTGARRGRPPGSKVIDGKLVLADQYTVDGGRDEVDEDRPKPSSQMAGAAMATDNDDSSEDHDSYGSSEKDGDEQVETQRPIPQAQLLTQKKSILTKADIMTSVEVPAYEISDDYSSDDEDWLERPLPPARGGTEESEGGDYQE